jgi:hypothetical protein
MTATARVFNNCPCPERHRVYAKHIIGHEPKEY